MELYREGSNGFMKVLKDHQISHNMELHGEGSNEFMKVPKTINSPTTWSCTVKVLMGFVVI
jgi:hypothetical protein